MSLPAQHHHALAGSSITANHVPLSSLATDCSQSARSMT